MIRDRLLQVEISAANLYSRLALRALAEGDRVRAKQLFRMAREERSQAQKICPGVKTGVTETRDRWSHYRPPGKKKWVWGSGLGSRDSRVRDYLGEDPETQDWDQVLPKLGSAELLIAVYYLLVLRDFKTFFEELKHARYNGVRIKYLVEGIRCLVGGPRGI
jgi:hypothetical protein